MSNAPRTCCILLTLVGSGLFTSLQAGSIDAIYAFGDSLSDVGNIYTETGNTIPGAPYVGGQFSNGPVWVQDLATGLGLAPLTPSLLPGGTDYAYGTGETGVTGFNTSNPATDLLGGSGQLAQFEAVHPVADPNALYTIWIGSNDLTDILASSPTAPQAAADIGAVAVNIDTAIGTLAALGAKNFLILTVPDLGLTPESISAGAAAPASALSAEFDATLVNGAGPIPSLSAVGAADSVNISVLNTYSLLDTIVSFPATFGFTNVTAPCVTGIDYNTYSGGTVCATPNQYLFWDREHPTAAADQVVADAALAFLTPEPASISLVASGLFGMGGLFVLRRRYCGNR